MLHIVVLCCVVRNIPADSSYWKMVRAVQQWCLPFFSHTDSQPKYMHTLVLVLCVCVFKAKIASNFCGATAHRTLYDLGLPTTKQKQTTDNPSLNPIIQPTRQPINEWKGTRAANEKAAFVEGDQPCGRRGYVYTALVLRTINRLTKSNNNNNHHPIDQKKGPPINAA